MLWQNCRHKNHTKNNETLRIFSSRFFLLYKEMMMLCKCVSDLWTNMFLWTMWRNPLVYPHDKCCKTGFSTELLTLSTKCVEKICGKMGNRCVFCGYLKSLKNQHSDFCGKVKYFYKRCYGNLFLNVSQKFLWVLTWKKLLKFQKILKKKKGI